jgi:transposase
MILFHHRAHGMESPDISGFGRRRDGRVWPAYSSPRVIHASQASRRFYSPQPCVNNSARKNLAMNLRTISPRRENTHRPATNLPAWHWMPRFSPSRRAMRWSLTNTQWRTATISRSHYKPFARISQRVFNNLKTMNASFHHPDLENDYAAFLAVDWADQKHCFSLQVAGECRTQTGTLEQKPEILGPWLAKLRERFGGRPIAVGLEQSRGALIHALMSYDFLVLYPLHPQTVAKFREAFKSSGAKSDPLDTELILQILTQHRRQLKALNPDSEPTRLLGRLVQDRRKAVDLRTRHIEALGASLKEYFPQALELLNGNLASRLAGDFLKKWSTVQELQQAKPSTLKRFYYGHNIRCPELIDKVLLLAQQAQPLTTDPAILESGRRLSRMHAQLIQSLNPIIADYDRRIATVFADHPESSLFQGLPGAGPALAPRLLAFFGTDRSRYLAAQNVHSFSGIAPVTKSSGKTKLIHMRQACPKFARQTFHEFARLSLAKCQWARNYVAYHTAKGKKFHTIIRALAFKWIRILFRCWQNKTPYQDAQYMQTLKNRGSIFATLHLEKKS